MCHYSHMKRYLEDYILSDLPKKIVLLSGPRQTGKTTLSKGLYTSFDYYNYDVDTDRFRLQQKAWDRAQQLVIFDELYKMKLWKRWLKGVYDTEKNPPYLLVTGSARLNTFRKVGDSLAGRYFSYRLHPIDLKEAHHYFSDDDEANFAKLVSCGGFPEPFFQNDTTYYQRWARSHIDVILRQDLIDMFAVRDIRAIETLVLLLKQRVGSCVSYANLARDLERDANTVKRWLEILEELYIIFRVIPYSKNISRSLLKEPKYYFYDIAQTQQENGARLENLVASALLKELHFIEDTTGAVTNLHYLRTKEGKELDFLICINNIPKCLIEVKSSDEKPSAAFNYFMRYFPNIKAIQLVKNLPREATYPNGLQVRALVKWLVKLNLTDD